MKIQTRYALAALLVLAATDTASAAGSLSGSFGVSSTVGAACQNLSTNAVSFGTYSPFSAADATTSATMTVTCTSATAFTLSFSEGTTTGATTAQRLMTNGTQTLQYNLYTDGTYATVLDASNTLSGTGAGPSSPQSVTVHAKAPKSQDVGAGTYTDTITVTVSY